MERDDIKKVLNCPFKELVLLALELVNLKDKERLAIDYTELKGNTIDETSEIMRCSPKSVKIYRRKAFEKMGKVWEGNKLVDKILKL